MSESDQQRVAEGDPPDGGDDATDGGEEAGVGGPSIGDAAVWHYLRTGTIGLLALLALVSTVQLYLNASAAIGRWVSPDYVPLFRVAFNLVVLLLALAGLAVVARRRGLAE